MINTKTLFQEKSNEIDIYYRFLEKSQKEHAYIQKKKRPFREPYVLDSDTQAILKANYFLLLYNMVESTIKSAVSEVYTVIKTDALSYADIPPSLQEIWIKKAVRDMKEASPDTYKDTIKSMIDEALIKAIMEFTHDHTPMSGNLDAQKIREICSAFGISYVTARRAKGGSKLVTVKNERNALAHGLRSFAECGRDYTVEDLKVIKNQTIWYIGGIIRNVELYIVNQKYKI